MYPLSHGACVTHSVCVCVCVCVCVRERERERERKCLHAFEHVYIFNALTSHLCLWRYIEAVRRLKKEGRSFPRTIHLTFMPGRPHSAHSGQQWELVCVFEPETARVKGQGWVGIDLLDIKRPVNMNLLDEASPGNVRICADRNICRGISL